MKLRLEDLNEKEQQALIDNALYEKEQEGVWLSDLSPSAKDRFAEAFYESEHWYGHPDTHESRPMGYPRTYAEDVKIEGSIEETAVKYAEGLKAKLLEMAEIRLRRYKVEIEQIKQLRGTPTDDLIDDYETLKRDLEKLN